MKKILSKMKALEWSHRFSHYKSIRIFQDAQGQLTPQFVARSGQILNSYELLWLSLLHARMKKIQLAMKAVEWSQDFPYYNPMGAISCHGNQSSDSI